MDLDDLLPSPAEIAAAAARIAGTCVRTPLVRSDGLSRHLGAEVMLKRDDLQVTGSFKLRGAFNALSLLPASARAAGVVASSAGNHGLGVAHAARVLGIAATVYVPAHAPQVKKDGIRALGAAVDDASRDYDHAMERATADAAATGRAYINPCLGRDLLAGQGTLAREILLERPDVRTIVVCVGGAGLLGGTAAWVRREAPGVRLVGVQTERTNAVAAALAAGRVVPIPSAPSLADGLAGQIDDAAFAIARYGVDQMVVLTEGQCADAIAWLWRHEEARAEGAGAVTVGALLTGLARVAPGPVACIVSGRNIDEARFRPLVAG